MRRLLSAAVLGVATMLTVACGSDDAPTNPDITPIPLNTLVFTRANQTPVTFASGAKLYVWCGAWEPGLISTPSVHVVYGGPNPSDPYWQLSAVSADITTGQPLTFPNNFVFDQPRKADIFLSDPSNELSTQTDRSSGSVTFTNFACSRGAAVQFNVNAVLGSEFANSPSVTMTGSFRGYVGDPPR